MKNVVLRSLTGALYVAVIVGAVLAGGWWMCALCLLFGVLGVNELNRITNRNFMSNTMALLDLIGTVAVIICCCPYLWKSVNFLPPVLPILGLIYFVYFIVRFIAQLYVQDGNALEHLSHSMLGQIYVVWPLALLQILHTDMGAYVVLSMFILNWLSDTGAFCVGSLFGKHKLFERISPHKSWEGFFGGLVFCLIAGALLFYFFPGKLSGLNLWAMIGLGAVVCIFGTWGDLIESMIKRSLGVKDSGNILPGHGGILDRIDSLLLVVPAVCFYLMVCAMAGWI